MDVVVLVDWPEQTARLVQHHTLFGPYTPVLLSERRTKPFPHGGPVNACWQSHGVYREYWSQEYWSQVLQ